LAIEAVDELRSSYAEIPPLEECDQAKIASALAQPFQSVLGDDAYPGDAHKVAAFMYFVVKCHACWTGAKRVTAALTLALLGLNGCWLLATSKELEDVVKAIAESSTRDANVPIGWATTWVTDRLERI
jgi:prophage maintenance system killer protein